MKAVEEYAELTREWQSVSLAASRLNAHGFVITRELATKTQLALMSLIARVDADRSPTTTEQREAAYLEGCEAVRAQIRQRLGL